MLFSTHGGNNKANPNCQGENMSPELVWSNFPKGTRSFAIVMDDQAGRAGLGVSHWVAYGIATNVGGLLEGEASGHSAKFTSGSNSVGSDIYFGPCPPIGDSPHHYVFTLIATKLEPGILRPGLSKTELMEALKGNTLGAASAVFRYSH
jgi:Raf kinase inhibitor-like YbhB/YbcL family protein